MTRFLAAVWAVFPWVLLSGHGDALAFEKMPQPKVEYSADMIMETGGHVINSKIYHAIGGKERQEINLNGNTQIMILRQDKKLSWMLMPEQKMYMEMNLDQAKQKMDKQNENMDVNDCKIDVKPMGDESVNGVMATKNKISMSCPNKANYEGYMWVTKDGIMVKMDAIAEGEGDKLHIKIDLNNLKIAEQNPSLFEVPAGYKKFDMSMSGFGSMGKGMAQPQPDVESTEPTSPAGRDYTSKSNATPGREYTSRSTQGENNTSQPVKTINNAIDTIDKFKGLFGK